MAGRRSRRWWAAALVAALAAVLSVLSASPAAAADSPDPRLTLDEAIEYLTEGPVFKEKCNFCHARIAESKSSEIIFQHGYHNLIPCSSCHTQFPHSDSGLARPPMKLCWNCHGLRHGPQGLQGSGKCEDCHRTPRYRLRPAFHVDDWEYAPHVKPGSEESKEGQLQTKCMMCHRGDFCEECHLRQGIRWDRKAAYRYDPKDGCLACHGDDLNLTKISKGQPKSFAVTGIFDSAHESRSCIECHPDFKYEEGADATLRWEVNAGLACQGCHRKGSSTEMDERLRVAEVYKKSVHGTKLLEQIVGGKKIDSATCASCHGGHYIKRLDNDINKTEMHLAAERMCARCKDQHKDDETSKMLGAEVSYYDTYDDYYHGAAYKRGSMDAPACWDCHASEEKGWHDILPRRNSASTISEKRIGETCKQCHADSNEKFGHKAYDLIHKKKGTRGEGHSMFRLLELIKGWFD